MQRDHVRLSRALVASNTASFTPRSIAKRWTTITLYNIATLFQSIKYYEQMPVAHKQYFLNGDFCGDSGMNRQATVSVKHYFLL